LAWLPARPSRALHHHAALVNELIQTRERGSYFQKQIAQLTMSLREQNSRLEQA
jgi:uncharacterized protein YydD (DUF2326 family)